MHKIDGPGATPDNRFRLGNANTGEEATQVTADWANAVQDELVNTIEGAGLTLEKSDNTQLLNAVKKLIEDGSISFQDQPQGFVFAGPASGPNAAPGFRKLEAADIPVILPVGMIAPYAGSAAPVGWLLCNGAAVSRTSYSSLFAVLGVTAGAGDGSTTFNVPDLRGRFLRGVDGGANRDPDAAARTAMAPGGATGNAVNTVQGDELKSHAHTYDMRANASGGAGGAIEGSNGAYAGEGVAIKATGGAETRPVNAYVNFIIKF